jgi:hypothetical protein
VLEEAAPTAVPADDPDADVVVFAVCVEVFDASPGNSTDISGSVDDDDALRDPLVPAPPCKDGKDDVGTLSGSDATVPLPTLV